jgi:hypothetical protein
MGGYFKITLQITHVEEFKGSLQPFFFNEPTIQIQIIYIYIASNVERITNVFRKIYIAILFKKEHHKDLKILYVQSHLQTQHQTCGPQSPHSYLGDVMKDDENPLKSLVDNKIHNLIKVSFSIDGIHKDIIKHTKQQCETLNPYL